MSEPCSSSSRELEVLDEPDEPDELEEELDELDELDELNEPDELDELDPDDLLYEQFGDLDITTTPDKEENTEGDDEDSDEEEPGKQPKRYTMKKPERVSIVTIPEEDDVRPVVFRRLNGVCRKRTPQHVAFNGIRQFHRATPTSTLDQIPVRTLAHTLEEYLAASRPYFPPSQKLGDELVAAAVENNEHIDTFLFNLKEKRLSQKQKVKVIQTMWWGDKKAVSKSNEKKAKRAKKKKTCRSNGTLPRPLQPTLKIDEEPFLFEQHYVMPMEKDSFLQEIQSELKRRTMSTRSTNDSIRDSSYFARQFFLRKSKISLRIQSSAELPACFAPPTLKCGYYPLTVTDKESQKRYLMSRYKEAHIEYLNICYRILEPPAGYSPGSITDEELYRFHNIGRHIHGFFLVWQEDGIDPILKTKKRYLVDAYNGLRFPLYVPWEHWETRLKVAFDRVIVYNLHLAECLRANRPVFDALAATEGLFQPLSMAEIIQQYKQSDHWIGSFTKFSLAGSRFLEAATRCNESYLSAFAMMVAGVKLFHPRRRFERNLGFHATYPLGSPLANVCEEMFEPFPEPLPPQPIRTRLLIPYEKPVLARKERLPRPVRTGVPLTRKRLMGVREKIYGYELPEIPQKEVVIGPPRRGRKPRDPLEEIKKKHQFDERMEASDIESDFEGFISEKNIIEYGAMNKTPLPRSTSSESIFLDYSYGELLVDRASLLNEQKIERAREASAKRRWRKMSRILYGREVRKSFVYGPYSLPGAGKKLADCLARSMPVTQMHAAKTKICMRIPSKCAILNIPRVYSKKETKFIDEVYGLLSDVIMDIEVKEIAEHQAVFQLALIDHDKITNSRNDLTLMRCDKTSALHSPDQLSMEMMTGNQMLSSNTINLELRSMLQQQNAQMLRFQMSFAAGGYQKKAPREVKYTVPSSHELLSKLKEKRIESMETWLGGAFEAKKREAIVSKRKHKKKAEKMRMLLLQGGKPLPRKGRKRNEVETEEPVRNEEKGVPLKGLEEKAVVRKHIADFGFDALKKSYLAVDQSKDQNGEPIIAPKKLPIKDLHPVNGAMLINAPKEIVALKPVKPSNVQNEEEPVIAHKELFEPVKPSNAHNGYISEPIALEPIELLYTPNQNHFDHPATPRFELIPPEPTTPSKYPDREPIPKLKLRRILDEEPAPTPLKLRLVFNKEVKKLQGARGLEQRIAQQKEAERREDEEAERLNGKSPLKSAHRRKKRANDVPMEPQKRAKFEE